MTIHKTKSQGLLQIPPSNKRLGRKNLSATNGLAYYGCEEKFYNVGDRMTNVSMIAGIILLALGAVSLVIGTIRCFTVKVRCKFGTITFSIMTFGIITLSINSFL